MTYSRVYTAEEKAFIAENCKGRSIRELSELFNKNFTPPITYTKIKGFMHNHKLCNGIDCRFKKGQVSRNKGIHKPTSPNCAKSYFKAGNRPHNTQEVGTERIGKNGYLQIKVAEPKTWISKQQYLYEQAHGKIPAGSVVIFADGNKSNFELDNLVCVTRAELAILCHRHLIYSEKELTKLGVLTAKVMLKSAERRKNR